MSSHITSDLERIADRVLCIDNGRITFDLVKDAITDDMGIARCRVADFERIAASGFIPENELRYRKHEYGIDLLVPDRFVFAENFRRADVFHRFTNIIAVAANLKFGQAGIIVDQSVKIFDFVDNCHSFCLRIFILKGFQQQGKNMSLIIFGLFNRFDEDFTFCFLNQSYHDQHSFKP